MAYRLLATTALCLASFCAHAADLPARTGAAPAPEAKARYDWSGAYGMMSLGAGVDRRATNIAFGSYSYNAGDVFYSGQASGNYVGNANSIPNGQLTPPAGFQTLIPHGYKLDTSWAYNLGTNGNSTGYQEATYPVVPTKVSDAKKISGVGALEVGYQRQMGDLVFGIGVDFGLLSRAQSESWASQGSYSGSSSFVDQQGVICGAPGGCSVSGVSQTAGEVFVDAKWLSTLRGRVGFAQDRLLMFATGGLAVGRVSMSSSSSYSDSNSKCLLGANPGGCGSDQSISGTEGTTAAWSGSKSSNRVGYALGAGVAYGLTEHVFLNAEALYYNLGTASLNVSGTGNISCSGNFNNLICAGSSGSAPQSVTVASYTVSKKFDGVIGRVGMAFKY